jgi:hypothetical protein
MIVQNAEQVKIRGKHINPAREMLAFGVATLVEPANEGFNAFRLH